MDSSCRCSVKPNNTCFPHEHQRYNRMSWGLPAIWVTDRKIIFYSKENGFVWVFPISSFFVLASQPYENLLIQSLLSPSHVCWIKPYVLHVFIYFLLTLDSSVLELSGKYVSLQNLLVTVPKYHLPEMKKKKKKNSNLFPGFILKKPKVWATQ